MGTLDDLIEHLRHDTGRDLRVAFSRDGKKAWINEITPTGEFVSISPKFSRKDLVVWLKGYHRALFQ